MGMQALCSRVPDSGLLHRCRWGRDACFGPQGAHLTPSEGLMPVAMPCTGSYRHSLVTSECLEKVKSYPHAARVPIDAPIGFLSTSGNGQRVAIDGRHGFLSTVPRVAIDERR